MPPRLSIQPASSRCRTTVSQLTQMVSCLSTTSRAAALKNVPSPISSVLSLEDPPSPPAPSSSSSSLSSSSSADAGSNSEANLSANDRLSRVWSKSTARHQRVADSARKKKELIEGLSQRAVSDSYVRQMPRRWKTGDVYAPHDLSPEEMTKWRRMSSPRVDVVDMLGINPLDEYRNFSIISEFITPMGRIKPSRDTGLRPVNQRKMAKAIRRAIGLGIHPSVHRHPMILQSEVQNMPRQNMPSAPKRNPRKLS